LLGKLDGPDAPFERIALSLMLFHQPVPELNFGPARRLPKTDTTNKLISCFLFHCPIAKTFECQCSRYSAN
jgi:hypothetical protein